VNGGGGSSTNAREESTCLKTVISMVGWFVVTFVRADNLHMETDKLFRKKRHANNRSCGNCLLK
jgi:hypothetical protein